MPGKLPEQISGQLPAAMTGPDVSVPLRLVAMSPANGDELSDYDIEEIAQAFLDAVNSAVEEGRPKSDDAGLTDSVDMQYISDTDSATFTETVSVTETKNVKRIIGSGSIMMAAATMMGSGTVVIPAGGISIEERLRNVEESLRQMIGRIPDTETLQQAVSQVAHNKEQASLAKSIADQAMNASVKASPWAVLTVAAYYLFKLANLPVTHVMTAAQISAMQNVLTVIGIILTAAIAIWVAQSK